MVSLKVLATQLKYVCDDILDINMKNVFIYYTNFALILTMTW